jgi:hypothetical protein
MQPSSGTQAAHVHMCNVQLCMLLNSGRLLQVPFPFPRGLLPLVDHSDVAAVTEGTVALLLPDHTTFSAGEATRVRDWTSTGATGMA